MLTRRLACIRRIVPFLVALIVPLFPSHAAQFTADLTITTPRENFVYDLKVKDNLIRLEKTQGPMTVPPFPTIYNRLTGVTWGLNPPLRQYVEETDPVKTMLMNPVVGWEYMRKDMTGTPAGTETVEGYPCEIMEYRAAGNDRVASRVWVSPDLTFTVKEVSYALNGNATMALRNIKEGPVDEALFKIPSGYTKAGPAADSSDRKSQKPVKAKKPLSTSVLIKPTSAHAIGLEPDRTITITAIGDDAGGAPSTADMKVLAKDKSTIISEKVSLKNGETKTWEVPAEKLPYDLYLNGGKGQVRFTVEQRSDAPAGETKVLPVKVNEKSKAAPPSAAASGNIIFILDASGSMWGQVEGTAKIAIAKEVLTGLIRDLPDDAVVGLVAYGHRRKGDCDDVEELVALGPLDKEKMVGRIQELSPKGKTPISRSVRLTAKRIKHLEDETTIILVSDGKETCDPDPCGLVKELKAAGIKFVMHVIGFDVTEEEREQLECMAEAGGGKYYTAGNAGEFLAAAREVVETPTFTGGYLKVTALKEGSPFDAYADVIRQSDNKGMGGQNTWYRQKPAEYKLVPDTYVLKVTDRSLTPFQTQEIRDIEIVSGQTVEKTVTFGGAGILRITAVKEGQPFDAYADVIRQSDNKGMGGQNTWYRQKPAEYKLVPDTYVLKVTDRSLTPFQTQEIRDIEIVSGQTVEKTVDFIVGGVLRITATRNGQPFDAYADVIRQSDNKGMGGQNTWYQKKPAEYKLVPGTYALKVTDRSVTPFQHQEIRDIEIVSGQTVEKTVDFIAGGVLRITATRNGQPFEAQASVYRQDDNTSIGGKNTWYQKKPAEYNLVPGVYYLKVHDRKTKEEKEVRDVEIMPGQSVEKTLAF
ncbi:VWA domain-containing protein [uncultured Desulfosarcina sp.]|uniref:vWA domain-containing protein n=1 Tax=uncultured Desulfosarcina sp. TaxID=218289 RepID=UPI0029C740FB|nr:VWA domain-containing protein [uncultured Desulfosarcina sp.]